MQQSNAIDVEEKVDGLGVCIWKWDTKNVNLCLQKYFQVDKILEKGENRKKKKGFEIIYSKHGVWSWTNTSCSIRYSTNSLNYVISISRMGHIRANMPIGESTRRDPKAIAFI